MEHPAQVREAGEHHAEDVGQAGPAGALAGERVELDEVLGDPLDQSPVEVLGVDHVVDEALQERPEVLLDGRAGHGAGMMVPFDGGFQCAGGSQGQRVAHDAGARKSSG